MSGTAEQLRQRIQSIVDDGRINGCITGSCMIDAEFDYWETMPDVDVFAYSTNYMIQAVEILINSLGCKWGETDTEISSKQEQTKYKWLLEGKKNNGFDPTLQTVKLHDDNGIVVNVSTRKNCRNVAQVVECFDMSIVMKGIDIRGKYVYDQTKSFSGDPKLAVPNPLKAQIEDVSMWDVKRWVRQFDRVLKYWGRGFDTRPVAKYYIELIDSVLAEGKLWTSENYTQLFDEFSNEFTETKARIAKWLEEVADA